jgi:hypothetical protein
MASSVAGTIPDQTWGQSLPGYFKDNVKPQIYESAYLIPRENVAIPDVITTNTVGTAYNRGFIDTMPPRAATIRAYIENPSTYVMRLHPHDLTSGTGGIDNLSNLSRFGQPTPLSNAPDFLDIEYWAGRELKRQRNDPLSNGYAQKVLGPQGLDLQMQMLNDMKLAHQREKYRVNKYTLDANRQGERGRQDHEHPAHKDVKLERQRRAEALRRTEQGGDGGDEDGNDGGDAGDDEGALENHPARPGDSVDAEEEADIEATGTDLEQPEAGAHHGRPTTSTNSHLRHAEAITGYNDDSILGQIEASQHAITYTAIARNQLRAVPAPISSMFANTQIGTTSYFTAPRGNPDSGPISAVLGSNQERGPMDGQQQSADAQWRNFAGRRSNVRDTVDRDPDLGMRSTQTQRLVRQSRDNRIDGDPNTMTTLVQLAGRSIGGQEPRTPFVRRTGAVSTPLTGGAGAGGDQFQDANTTPQTTSRNPADVYRTMSPEQRAQLDVRTRQPPDRLVQSGRRPRRR